MSLIQLLQEASSLSLPDIKKAMLKDKVASLIFKKDLTLDDISDKDSFLATIKYFLFNNENVRAFIAMRNNVRELDAWKLKSFRAMRGSGLDEQELRWLKSFVSDIFKEHSLVDKGSMTTDLKRELRTWFNTSGTYFNLPPWAMKELMSIPSLRPDKRILLYRGVLFKEHSLKMDKAYDGTLTKGNGLKFLQSIRKGGRVVDLDWDRPSSWTKSKEIAERFAMNGPSSSSFGATLKWFDKAMNASAIDGALGYVISTFANPEDVLVDAVRISAAIPNQHGDEAEVILKPGTYLARVVKKFTRVGEVNPEEPEEEKKDGPAITALATVQELAKVTTPPEEVSLLDKIGYVPSYDAIGIMRDMPEFKQFLLNSTTTKVIHAFDTLLEFYNKELKAITDEHLSPEQFARDSNLSYRMSKLKAFIKYFNVKEVHSKFLSPTNKKSAGPRHELTAEEYRNTINASDLKYLEKDLLTSGKLTNADSGKSFDKLAKYLKYNLPSTKFWMMGAVKQQPVIKEVIDKFFKEIGLDKKENQSENARLMISLIRKAHRNAYMLEQLKDIHAKLGKLNEKD